MSLISLNIKGLGGEVKWSYLKSLIVREKSSICLSRKLSYLI